MIRCSRRIQRLVACAGLALVGCPALHVGWADYNPGSFEPMVRFAFAPPPELSPDQPVDRETRKASHALATREMRAALERKGYVDDPEQPDFVVHYQMGEGTKGVYQPYGRNLEGELDVWFVKRGERDRFWHGWASLTLYGKIDAADEIEKAVLKVLDPVPPRR